MLLLPCNDEQMVHNGIPNLLETAAWLFFDGNTSFAALESKVSGPGLPKTEP